MKRKNQPVLLRVAAILFVFTVVHVTADSEAGVDLDKLSKIPASGFTKILDQSISPDKRLAVAIGTIDGSEPHWEKLDVDNGGISFSMDEEKACAFLVDIRADRVKSALEMQHFGTRNTYNHESAVVFWSPDSRWLVEAQDWKWHTGVCSVHRINAENSITSHLDLLTVAKKVVDDTLRKQSPGLTQEQRDGYAVRMGVVRISNEGNLTAEVSAELPKDENSEYIHVSVAAKLSQVEDGKLSIEITKVKPIEE